MIMDVRNMIAIAATVFALLAVIISGAAYGKIQNVDECCGPNPSSSCGTVSVFNFPCVTAQSCDSENAILHDGCCYVMAGNSGSIALIFCAITLGGIIFTGVMGECLENCPACCQNCSACIIGFVNVLGLGFCALVIGFSIGSPDSDGDGCDASIGEATETAGMLWAYLILLSLAQLLSCAVAVMSSSCCQPKDEDEVVH